MISPLPSPIPKPSTVEHRAAFIAGRAEEPIRFTRPAWWIVREARARALSAAGLNDTMVREITGVDLVVAS